MTPADSLTAKEPHKPRFVATRKVVLAFAIEKSRELLAGGVPVLCYYFIGKSNNIQAMAAALF
jgi:methylenetetrahydrofolate reductase (NADPH)